MEIIRLWKIRNLRIWICLDFGIHETVYLESQRYLEQKRNLEQKNTFCDKNKVLKVLHKTPNIWKS